MWLALSRGQCCASATKHPSARDKYYLPESFERSTPTIICISFAPPPPKTASAFIMSAWKHVPDTWGWLLNLETSFEGKPVTSVRFRLSLKISAPHQQHKACPEASADGAAVSSPSVRMFSDSHVSSCSNHTTNRDTNCVMVLLYSFSCRVQFSFNMPAVKCCFCSMLPFIESACCDVSDINRI